MNDLQNEGISTELQTVAETSLEEYGNPYDKILELAMRQGEPLDKLEKWMALKERHEANEARKAYHEAMSAFKRSPPEISKDKTVQYSGTKYNHASLANVASKISAALSRNGLYAGWKTEQHEDTITVTCTISHILGHSESTSLSAAPDKSGAKNAIQAVGSTISYLERYTILAITGLATHDMDDDGIGSECAKEKKELLPSQKTRWQNAMAAYMRDGNFKAIEEKAIISDENKKKLIEDCNGVS